MIFSLDIQRAQKGDCLILHYGTKDDPGLVIIDGGPRSVYKPHLKPRLVQIRQARNLDSDRALAVDLLMVSHIDDDHIFGILELTRELQDAMDSSQPLLLNVHKIWHNTFDDLLKTTPAELLSAVTASFGAASLSGEPDVEGLHPDTAMVLASVPQGMRLRDDARKLGLSINSDFDEKLIMATADGKAKVMGKGLKLTVAGPMQAELVALQKKHDDFLKQPKKDRETQAALASLTDDEPANLSSLVILAEVDTKRMLLTGDARSDKILEGLQLVGLLGDNDILHVDILKMPHHGSDRNVDPIFFQRLTADHYVFSGNGEHGNPERETLQMLLDERGDESYTVHLTYPVEEIDINREENWVHEQKRDKARKKKNPNVKVRKDWSPKTQSLTSFFAEHPNFAKKVQIVEENKSHTINLLEKIDF